MKLLLILLLSLMIVSCGNSTDKERFVTEEYIQDSNVPFNVYEIKDNKTATTYLVTTEGVLLDKFTSFEIDSLAGR